jgi:hypothetical protein
MNASHIDALSAMFDGESVDPAILREALTDPGAPDWLVEFAAWRSEFRQDSSRPSDEFYRAMAPILRPSRLRRLFSGPRLHLPAAAALALVAGAIGFAVRPAVERPTPPVSAVQAAGAKASPGPSPAAGQPTILGRTSGAVSPQQAHTEVIVPKARHLPLSGWRESRISSRGTE